MTTTKQDFVAGDHVTYTTSSVVYGVRTDYHHEATILSFPDFRSVTLAVKLRSGKLFELTCSRKAISAPRHLQGYKGELLSAVARRSRAT